MGFRVKVGSLAFALAVTGGIAFSPAISPVGATVTHVGDCTDGSRALGTITPGLLPTKGVNTISLKALQADHDDNGVGDGLTKFGSCTFDGGPGSGTHQIAAGGFSSKVVGTTSCTPGLAADPSDVISSGKGAWKFTDSTVTDFYVSITGFKSGSSNVVQSHGIVTKGNGLGSFLTAENAFLPVVKAKAGNPLIIYSTSDGKTNLALDLSSQCAGGSTGVPLKTILVSAGGSSGANAPSFDIGTVTLS